MAARTDRRKPILPERIITEGDLQIKELLRKQIDTNVTVESQLSQMKTFSSGQVYASTTDLLTGEVSLEEFSRLLKQQEQTDELRQFGLNEEEISIKLQHDKFMHHQAHHTTNSPDIPDMKSNSEQLKVIEQKIADKTRQLSQPTTFAGAKPLSRHEMDLEKAVTRDRDATKVFHCLVTSKSVDSIDPDHPINHLDQIWKDVMASKPTCRKRKRKRKVALVTDEISAAACNMSEQTSCDCLEHKDDPAKSLAHASLKSLSSDYSKDCNIEPIPTEVIERYRLTVEQIKKLPRFENYSAGTPNQTLYLKNLSPRVTEEDLVSLFGQFQQPDKAPIIYKLMRGRMKGQAFVTFDSVEMASAALTLVNGYDFKGKPIIIAYGRKTHINSEAASSCASTHQSDVTSRS